MSKYQEFTASPGFKRWALPAVLLFTALVFLNSLFNGFTNWDDNIYVLNNQLIKHFSWDSAYTIMFRYTGMGGTRLTLLNFLLDYHLFKDTAFPYHLANLLLHLGNVALVWMLTQRLFREPAIAAFAALMFGIHPMHVESVAWIAERKDVLYTFFFLLSLLSYHQYLKNTRKILWVVLSFTAFFLSWHAKMSAACLPLMLILMDYATGRKFSWKALIEKLPFFAYVIILLSKIFMFHESSGGDFQHAAQPYTFFDRILMGGYALGFYLWKFFLPFNLVAIHPYPEKTDGLLPLQYYIVTGIMLLVLIVLIWAIVRFRKIRRELLTGLLFFIISIAMFTHLVPIKGVVVVADRYTYLPYAGLLMLGGFLLHRLLSSEHTGRNIRRVVIPLIAAVVMLFGGLTFLRNFVWKDSLTLFSDVIRKNPNVVYAYNNRGIALKDLGDLKGALADFDAAIRISPGFPYSYSNRGIALLLMNEKERALADLNMAISIKADYFEAYFNRALVKKESGDTTGMMEDLEAVLRYRPSFPQAHYEIAQERYRRKEYQEAMTSVNRALETKKSFPEALFLRGNIFKDQGDYNAAIKDYSESVRIFPEYAEAYNNRGFSKNALGQYESALTDLERALAVNSKLAEAWNNKGIALANLQRPAEAIAAFDQAIEIRPNYREAINNRGNARAYMGDFAGSVADFDKVLELNPADSMALANRGNSKFNLQDTKGACDDWNAAYRLGFTRILPAIEEHCR